MAHIVLFDRMAFQKVKLDAAGNRTVMPDGEEVIVLKGGYVPDWVPEWQLAAYAQSGMITPVADRPVFAEPDPVGPVPPMTIDSPPAPGSVGSPIATPDQQVIGPDDQSDDQGAGNQGAQTVLFTSTAPSEGASRAVWEDYATSDAVGMTEAEVKSYPNKGALIDAVTAKTSK
jgi:hypothetical protein